MATILHIFSNIVLFENCCILIHISLKFAPKGTIYIMPAFVQIMGWRLTGDKPLSKPLMVLFSDAYIYDLVQDCSNSIAKALELLQSCTKQSMCQ